MIKNYIIIIIIIAWDRLWDHPCYLRRSVRLSAVSRSQFLTDFDET